MKNKIISILQKLLGFEDYLFYFAIFIYWKLKWDKNERDFLKIFEIIPNYGYVLDIGANIGVMTAHFAKKLNNSFIYSFEPIPFNSKTLKRLANFLNLKNYALNEIALSDRNGEVEMIVPVIGSAKKQGLSHVKNEVSGNDEEGLTFKVPVKKLDDLNNLFNDDKPITAIKIDVEGHEMSVFRGGINIIKKHRPIIYCELWENEDRHNVLGFFKDLNYAPQVIVNNKFADYTSQKNQNFFLIPLEVPFKG